MRHVIIIIMILSAVLLVGCASGGASTPEVAAKNWIDALFSADGDQMRDNMCKVQAVALNNTIMNGIREGLAGGGAVDVSGLTYSYNQATQSVTIGGVVRISAAGQTIERALGELGLNILPVIQEEGGWKVCLSL
ncbi:MAG: hypothetical protein KJ043_08725 [Anaerolineae bacterium]|nr:hypothetical protein [Anaerolineae bacterium]